MAGGCASGLFATMGGERLDGRKCLGQVVVAATPWRGVKHVSERGVSASRFLTLVVLVAQTQYRLS